MKNRLFYWCFHLFASVFSCWLHAQRHDNVWVMGYNTAPNNLNWGILFEFNDSLTIRYRAQYAGFFNANTSISDSLGRLVLMSNGCYVADSAGNVLPGGHGLNPGLLYNIFCPSNQGYTLPQSLLTLPDPVRKGVYHIFHVNYVASGWMRYLHHTLVDMHLNGGQGGVVFKNAVVVEDSLHYGELHAVRHGNGRDWWVVAPTLNKNRYYIVRLDPSGVQVKHQDIGPVVETNYYHRGQAAFSPDGTRYARYNALEDLRLFDFDRCLGELSSPRHILVLEDSLRQPTGGLAWSADGRYLYISDAYMIMQFDMAASDISASRVVVARRQPPVCFLSGALGEMELGPDGVIYCAPLAGQQCMHRIKHPERRGEACEVEHNYYRFQYGYQGLPHFPNFRLGPVDGSACDTLGLDNRPLSHWRYERAGGLRVDFVSVSWYEPEWYSWDFGDPGSGLLNYSDQKYPSHEYPAPGPYQVCLTVGNSYGTDTKCKTVWVLSTSSAGEGLVGELGRLYPNPSSGQLFWSGEAPVRVRLFSAAGQLVLEEATDGGALWVGHLPEGFYVAQVFDARDRTLLAVQKVVLKR
ncbi:MAG: PKD domain-containing protein [Saprospiraceae bacterium]|nr:PKD domain-containing protein [Saprospiraceae bacterium]